MIIILVLLCVEGIYLYNKPCDYQVHFTVNTTPEIVYYNIQNWNFWNRKHLSAGFEILKKVPVSNISQKVLLRDTTLIFNWEFKELNDSATMVRVYVSDPHRKFYNRLTALFRNTSFKKSVRKNLLDIKSRLEFLLKTFHYEFTGYHHFEKKACVYINIKTAARDKASSMIANVTDLNQFVRQNNLELNGNPFNVYHDWKEFQDSIDFDFCFPIAHKENIPQHPFIKFMMVDEMDAIKTDFFGHYGISDIAWYNLTKEADVSGYRSTNRLVEVFLNDPHSGGNESEWKAEIYLGIDSIR